ncbi:MAG TPA: M20/M25/M40 family metallo-hydrolase [Gemmatimonadota bacterium]|nr:M20/M25/M40 family metallo-hydrolase [Gemmatimonadota bacterium]
MRTALLAGVSLVAAALLAAGPLRAQIAAGAAGGGLGDASSPFPSVEELNAHVAHLASDALAGRRAGTPGAERAARYIVQTFSGAGLIPAPGYPTYLQSFDFPVGVELGPENRLVVQHGSRIGTSFQPGRDFLPLSGSVADRVVQPVVFAGYGISAPTIGWDDYEGIDVEGKIVLVLRLSPEGDKPASRFGRYISDRYKAANASAHGAKAILLVNGPATEEIDRLIPFSVDEEPGSLGIVALSVTQAVARRIVAVAGEDLSMWQHLINRESEPHSRPIENAVVNLRADLRPRLRTTHNVIGVVPGRDPQLAREVVVVGAHYDGLGLGGPGSLDPVPGEVHNGADDNASGVSALIELAEYFAYPANRPDRTLAFVAFGAEEEGMLGSAWFVSNPPWPIANVTAMINMDMIGRLGEELTVYGVGSSGEWHEVLERANADVGAPIVEMDEGYGPSDHVAFYLRQIPVLAFFTGVHEDYHRASDDVERLNLEGLLSVTRVVRGVVAELADRPRRLSFDPRQFQPREIDEPVEEEPELPPPLKIGVVPGPADGTPGVPVDALVEDSPGVRAGVRAGDRVMQVGTRRTETIYDYVQALREVPRDAEWSMVVLRDGAEVTLTFEAVEAP